MPKKRATAFAPASVGNIAVGFDLLGHALEGAGDTVTVTRTATLGVRITKVEGVTTTLPLQPEKNTVTAGLVALSRERALTHGFDVEIHKGIALGSGMGGSAASAAAGIVAASAVLDEPLTDEELYRYGLIGEAVASGSAHGDNLAPCLFGGVQLVLSDSPMRLERLPVPADLHCVLVHPHLRVDTRDARAVLQRGFELGTITTQTRNLAGFLIASFRQDAELLRDYLSDVLVEPWRAPLVPGFKQVKQAALQAGALGCSISGAGPSVFAWCAGTARAEAAGDVMTAAFKANGLESDAFISKVDAPGARIIEVE